MHSIVQNVVGTFMTRNSLALNSLGLENAPTLRYIIFYLYVCIPEIARARARCVVCVYEYVFVRRTGSVSKHRTTV